MYVCMCVCIRVCVCVCVPSTTQQTTSYIFTKEEENDNQLAFLEVLLTHTDQILNYNSNHPTVHESSCIKSLFHCNTQQTKKDERNYLYMKPSSRTTTPKTLSIKSHHRKDVCTKTQVPCQMKLHKTKKERPYTLHPHCVRNNTRVLVKTVQRRSRPQPYPQTDRLAAKFTRHKDRTAYTEKESGNMPNRTPQCY